MIRSTLKKFKIVLTLSLAVALVAPITLPTNQFTTHVSAATVSISKKKLNLKVGASKKLQITGTKDAITWSSSDNAVATVSKTGTVTAKATGTAKITAKVSDNTYVCKVTVAPFANKTITAGNISYAIPKSWKTEDGDFNGIPITMVYPKSVESGDTTSSVINYLIPLEESITLKSWKEAVAATVSEELQLQALQLQLGDTCTIENFTQKAVKDSNLSTIYTTFDILLDGEKVYQCYIYDVYLGSIWFETVGTYTYDSTSPSISKVVSTIASTLQVAK